MPLKAEPAFTEEMFDPVNTFLMHRPTEFQQNVQDQSKKKKKINLYINIIIIEKA